MAAEALDVQSGDRVLDMCAAPGGKTLVLAPKVAPSGSLIANDRSSSRRNRLHRVLDAHLPADVRKLVTITSHDATRWCLHETGVYDKILLDVPCSSEQHVLASPSHLATWSQARSRNLATQAYAMLAGAVLVLKPGGTLVYSTCTVSNRENEEVVKRLVEKKTDLVELVQWPGTEGEWTGYGTRIWPDRIPGSGPIFFSIIRRVK